MSSITNSVSTWGQNLLRRQTVNDLTQQLIKAEYEVSTGLLQDVYGTLGPRAAEALSLRSQMATSEAFVDSNTLLANRMEVTSTALGNIRDLAQGFLDQAIVNRDAPGGTVDSLQATARATLDQLVAAVNTTYQGSALFSGSATDATSLNGWTRVDPDSGLAPGDLVTGITGDGPGTLAEAQDMIAQLDAVFAGTAATGYDGTFYNGSTEPGQRLSARIDTGTSITYGVQANDPGFTKVMQGLSMIIAVDPDTLEDPDVYAEWMGSAVDKLSSGMADLLASETQLGSQQARVATMIETQTARIELFNSQVLDLEGVDEYEAATRLTALQTQLQASYQITSLMSSMSFLNFMD